MLAPPPQINIEFCCTEAPIKEPASPFDNLSFPVDPVDAPRSLHLLPPPARSPKERMTTGQQPTRPGHGLDPLRFEALRNSARATPNSAKLDLRKEVALRVHQSKQIERRKLFLSKIEALPSPTAASLPVTPPESPAVFHFTLPSPGLVSPLALFESLENGNDSRPVRVEQVDFRARARKEAESLAALTGNMRQSLQVHGLPAAVSNKAPPHKPLPSLDQITKRLGGNVTVSRTGSPASRLPAFLQRPPASAAPISNPPPSITVVAPEETVPLKPKVQVSFAPTNTHGPIARPTASTGTKSVRPPLCPASVTLAGPHIASTKAPTPLTAEALTALADRAERGSVMMERLQRRFSAPARLSGQKEQRILARPAGGF